MLRARVMDVSTDDGGKENENTLDSKAKVEENIKLRHRMEKEEKQYEYLLAGKRFLS